MCAFAVLLASLIAVAAMPAMADEPRIALVIGNRDYMGALHPLPNAVNDAHLIADALHHAGFDVIELPDADRTKMSSAIKSFKARLEAAGPDAVGLFYFAGHGLQVDGTNYLMATDAPIGKPADIARYGVQADDVLWAMLRGGANTAILVLDACRPNDVSRLLNPLAKKGLAKSYDARGIDEDRNLFFLYSTGFGQNALDGERANSPFAKALADNILIPNLSINDLYLNVRVQMKGTGQIPWQGGSMGRKFAFVGKPE
jgi:uncharacterized caspase-like protein